MKIGILSNRFIEWGGGIAFLQLCLQALENCSKKNNITVILLMPKTKKYLFKNTVKTILNIFIFRKFKIKNIIKDSYIIDQLVNSVNIKVKLVRYNNTIYDLEQTARKEDIDILLPSFENLGKNFIIPWIGYIYDFQHKEMPEYFTEKDIKSRDVDFLNMILNSKSILVNSEKVKSDINKYLEYKTDNIFALPFTPFSNKRNSGSPLSIFSKYNISGKYFVIANQFWRHKDHLTAFIAFAYFCTINSEYQLVCTGDLSDYRNPSYMHMLKDVLTSNSIENKVIFTGFLKKVEMLLIIENAICLIQPTIYEGGPGGGAVYDAYSYGIPILLSDIEINDEVIDCGNIIRFEKQNANDLFHKMQLAIAKEKVDYSIIKDFILTANEDLGDILYDAIVKTIQKKDT